ncbi:hypothetical protein P7C71_g4505, partial [Lecanoromycetidae sp. Uapishka_2]
MNLGNTDLIRWHLQHGADPKITTRRGYTALDYAGYKYSLEVVKLLVQHGADVSKTTAIHNAVLNPVKISPSNPGRLDIVGYLLGCGTNINQLEPTEDEHERPPTTPYTGTPLHRAVQSKNPENVSYLLSRGANPSIKGAMGLTPLEVAEHDHLKEIETILRKH